MVGGSTVPMYSVLILPAAQQSLLLDHSRVVACIARTSLVMKALPMPDGLAQRDEMPFQLYWDRLIRRVLHNGRLTGEHGRSKHGTDSFSINILIVCIWWWNHSICQCQFFNVLQVCMLSQTVQVERLT